MIFNFFLIFVFLKEATNVIGQMESNRETKTLDARLDSLLNMFQGLESKLNESKEESRKQLAELSAKLKDRNNRLEMLNRLQRNQTQTILNQMDSFKEEFSNKYNEANNRINEFREETSLKLNELAEQLRNQNKTLEAFYNLTQQAKFISIKEPEDKTEEKTEDLTDKISELNNRLTEIRDEILNKSQQIEQNLQERLEKNEQQVNDLNLSLNNLNDKLETVHLNQTNYESKFDQLNDELNNQNYKIQLLNEFAKNVSLNQTKGLEAVTDSINQLKKENEQKYDELKAKLNDQYEEFNDKINENKSLIFYPIKKESELTSDQKESNDLINDLREETQSRYAELTNTLSQHVQLIQNHDLKFNQIELMISNQSDLFLDKIFSLKLETETFNFKLKEIKEENKNHNDLLVNRMDSVVNSISMQASLERSSIVKNRFSLSAISYSLSHDISIKNMQAQGYQVVYDHPYSHSTSFDELISIKSDCDSDSLLCVGGTARDSDILLLVSCGKCRDILVETQPNQPVLHNGAYWYLTRDFSFGFAPIYEIRQENSDHYDSDSGYNDNKRLSWYLGGSWGGWRLGKFHNLGTSAEYRKVILLNK